ncbi:hypothetical protein JCM6882_008830 [Rhodosporidiobolus microsporus]
MPEPQQTTTPPSSTSLPQHWQFVPPPTDGPNTRARRARGQLPYSGTAAPLPVELAVRGTGREGGDAGGRGEIEEWNAWNEAQPEQQYWYAPGPPTADGETFFAIDPSLAFDPSSLSSLPYAVPTPAPDHSLAFSQSSLPPSSYGLPSSGSSPPPPAPLFPQPPPLPPPREDRRLFSTSSVIDYGSPPSSPPLVPVGGSSAEPNSLAMGMGISKEEWLRLGGFGTENGEVKPFSLPPASTLVPLDEANTFGGLETGPSRSAHPLGATSFPPPSPAYGRPPPSASAPPATTFVLPPPPPNLAGLPYPSVLAEADELPVPPESFTYDFDASLSSRPPTRSSARRAPSPLVSRRLRPSPYPTSGNSSLPFAAPELVRGTSSSSSASSAAARNLTPVSAALATYHHYPPPSAPPPPASAASTALSDESPKKKKVHTRRLSANHIPRPRNAFILFRSHAVQSGLIPKSMGISDHKHISQIVGSVWRGLSDEERKQWDDLAEEEKRQHREKYPNYVFKPKQKGQRAPAGQGKKALAKAARMEAERAREEALTGATAEADGDDEGDGGSDYEESYKPRPSRRRARTATVPVEEGNLREQRRMELIGQAMLEGEDEERILQRVDEEIEREEQALYGSDIPVASSSSSPTKSTRRSPPKPRATTPRKTRSSTQPQQQRPPTTAGDILVESRPVSPTSSASVTPTRHSPYHAATAHRRHALPSSPASSNSPSPKRMQQAGPLRGAGSPPTSAGRHPLSRSHPAPPTPQEDALQEDDLPAARRAKKAGAYSGLGVASSTFVLPPTPFSDSGPSPTPTLYQPSDSPELGGVKLDQPLFAGPADSRNFSLGRWELRKPSTAASSRREVLARQEEEQEGAGVGAGSTAGWLDRAAGGGAYPGPSQQRISSAFAIDPKEFLVESGLEGDEDGFYPSSSSAGGAANDRWETASVLSAPTSSSAWASSYAASTFSGYEPSLSSFTTASNPNPPRSSRSPPKAPLFRRDPTVPSSFLSSSGASDPFAASPFASTFPAGAVAEPAVSEVFHFGSVDLFAKPPPALGGSTGLRKAPGGLTGGGGGDVGLGISYGEVKEEGRG